MRLIDADKVYPWYLEMFSAKTIGKEREIKPNEERFSMNDIRENLSNIPTEQEPMIFKSSVMMNAEDIEKYHQKIKEQMKEGVVLLPHYIDLVRPQELVLDKIIAEIHENAEMKSDGEWYLNEKWIMQIIDKYM